MSLEDAAWAAAQDYIQSKTDGVGDSVSRQVETVVQEDTTNLIFNAVRERTFWAVAGVDKGVVKVTVDRTMEGLL